MKCREYPKPAIGTHGILERNTSGFLRGPGQTCPDGQGKENIIGIGSDEIARIGSTAG